MMYTLGGLTGKLPTCVNPNEDRWVDEEGSSVQLGDRGSKDGDFAMQETKILMVAGESGGKSSLGKVVERVESGW